MISEKLPVRSGRSSGVPVFLRRFGIVAQGTKKEISFLRPAFFPLLDIKERGIDKDHTLNGETGES